MPSSIVNPKALEEAAALDAKFKKSGPVGPLHGIPVLLKDNVNTKDMPTTGGSKSLEGYVPPNDAFITKKLRDAGAIIIAKVNLHEFAVWGESVSSMLGQTLNPYDLTRTPGGSSGGTGAGLAANFGILGIGTDTVNSIRSPASANSIVGIRPTIGLVSRDGIIPYSFTQDAAGPMARTVTDATKMLNVLTGYDPGDQATAWSIGNIQKDYAKYLKKDGLKGKRIGILRSFFGTQPIHEEVNAVTNKAIEDCKKMGATLVELNTPDIDSGKIANDISVHLYDLRPDLDSYLGDPKANTPVKSLEQIIASGKYHPGIEKNIKEAMTLKHDASYYERLAKRTKLQDRVMAHHGRTEARRPHLPAPEAARRPRGRHPGRAQRKPRLRDGLPLHRGARRVHEAHRFGEDRRARRSGVLRAALDGGAADRDRLRLRAGHEESSPSRDDAEARRRDVTFFRKENRQTMDKSGYTLLPNRADNKCFGCGPANPQGLQMQFYTNGETVASWITVPPHLCGWSNLAHGGILFTALDEIMGRTMIYLLQRFILTKSMTIEYLKPVPHGREFKVEGRILEVRSEREAAAEGIITNDAGEICTRATGLWATFTPDSARKLGVADDETFRWFEQVIATKR